MRFRFFPTTHRPLSSSFLGLSYRILNIYHKKELLWSLWVNALRINLAYGSGLLVFASHRLLSSSFLGLPYRNRNINHKKESTQEPVV